MRDPVSKKEDFFKAYAFFKELHAIAGDAVYFEGDYVDWTENSYRTIDVDYNDKLKPCFTLTTFLD